MFQEISYKILMHNQDQYRVELQVNVHIHQKYFHLEYLFHVWLAGTGMFLLIYNLIKNKNIALLAGISYMLIRKVVPGIRLSG